MQHAQCVTILSTPPGFTFYIVTCSYSSRPFLCTFDMRDYPPAHTTVHQVYTCASQTQISVTTVSRWVGCIGKLESILGTITTVTGLWYVGRSENKAMVALCGHILPCWLKTDLLSLVECSQRFHSNIQDKLADLVARRGTGVHICTSW